MTLLAMLPVHQSNDLEHRHQAQPCIHQQDVPAQALQVYSMQKSRGHIAAPAFDSRLLSGNHEALEPT
eukprot:575708-Pelagomonas_calceolata.AAC.10